MSPAKSIVTFPFIRNAVKDELMNVGKMEGIKWKRFPGLNKYVKGHRSGELTILTGPTGCGKTTFLSEYSLDLCLQGLPTLWGNFEMKNSKLCRTMLNQFAQHPLIHHLKQFDKWADDFAKIPMYFMAYHGQQEFENVLKVMDYSIQNLAVKHVIIDNLQFMIGTRNKKLNFLDRYEYQDHVIGRCRTFATQNDCHVTLVIHPRKEDGTVLTMNSIFGGAKASQEADNILILQVEWKGNLRQRKYLQISKNRYDGDLGTISLRFNKETQGFGVTKSKGFQGSQITQDVEEAD